jgi:4-methylaminobutanoate oxidase (formaldehyde-forming)
MEKAFRHYGHDITDEDHVLEAGLGFAVRTEKGDFSGRAAMLRKREARLSWRLMRFRLADPALNLFHNEPILRDSAVVGCLTSGGYGHALGVEVGLGYVHCAEPGESAADMLASDDEIGIAELRLPAQTSLKPLYHPKSERPKA